MAKFLSEEWINLYKEEWNKNEKLKEGLKTFSAKIKYYIEGKEEDAVHLIVENGYLVKNHQAGNKFHLINTKAKALYNALMDLA